MKWTFLHRSWSDLTALISPPWSKLHQERRKAKENERANYFRSCGICPSEARRRKREWMKEPGALDDWNDTRSILDM